MALFDLSLEDLRTYLPVRHEPADFDSFWRETLAQQASASAGPTFAAVETHLAAFDVRDVTFPGFAGQPIKAWLVLPKGRSGPLPCVVEYLGYGRGRGLPIEWLAWAAVGYAHLVVDARGQGGQWSAGETPDKAQVDEPHFPGFLTRGIQRPETYYYRRLIADSVRAVDAALDHPDIDPARIVVCGTSQGGGLALAVAALRRDIAALLCDVPFLCDIRRATEITDAHPYAEIAGYLRIHRTATERVFATLAHFDGINFAPRATAPALFSVGLMDQICPPSTVFAAFNYYAGRKRISVWPYNGHDGGGPDHAMERISFLKELGLSPT